MEDKEVKIITHSGSFHTDEAFAVATLMSAVKKPYKIVRTRDLDVIKTGDYVVDTGWVYDADKNLFDHHQEGGAGKRPNGIPYSSFGLVWKKFGIEVCGGSVEAADLVDRKLVSPIDASDNRIDTFIPKSKNSFPYVIHDITMAFRPTWKEEQDKSRDYDTAFNEFVLIAKKILEREVVNAVDEAQGSAFVRSVYEKTEDKRIIIIDRHYPWEDLLEEFSEPLYVAQPDKQNGGKWKVTAVRDSRHTFKNRKSFPVEWAGKRGDELTKITGVLDAVYCHNDRFIAIAGSREGAVALARIAVEY